MARRRRIVLGIALHVLTEDRAFFFSKKKKK